MNGIVLYADGGVKPNPGKAGYGIHGYFFECKEPTKGIGLGSISASSVGYVNKEDLIDVKSSDFQDKNTIVLETQKFPVTITKYIDAFGTVGTVIDGVKIINDVSNNKAEAEALNRSLKIIQEHKPDFAIINSDSELTVRGFNEWMRIWSSQNWIKKDGNPVASTDVWKEILESKKILDSMDIPVKMVWVKGHDGDTGNERADSLATIGRFTALRSLDYHSCDLKDPDGYWKSVNEKHPFFLNKYCYFNTRQETITPGVYYTGNHGKDNHLNGNRMSDRTGSVIKIAHPDPVIEMIRNFQSRIIYGLDMMYVINLDKVFSANIYDKLNIYGELLIEPPVGFKKDLKTLGDSTITEEQNPPRLSERTYQSLEDLGQILDSFITERNDIVLTDITDSLYEQQTKQGKKNSTEAQPLVETKLLSSIGVGCSSIKVKGKFKNERGTADVEITLSIGIDTLERNSLKKIESKNPKVYFVSWSAGENLFRYATIIKAGDDVGIWSGIDSNTRVIFFK